MAEVVDDPAFSVATGVVLWGMEQELAGYRGRLSTQSGSSNTTKKILDWFKNFMP